MEWFRDKTVLVLDDEPLIALDLALALEDAGAVVAGPAHTVSEALAMIARHPVDAALLDINLRGETSYPVAAQLIAMDVPFLFVSSMSRGEVPDQYQMYLYQKPADLQVLGSALFST